MFSKADEIEEIKRRLSDIEHVCDSRNEQHGEYRRSTDNKVDGLLQYQKSTDETLKEILGIIKDHLPTIKRTKDNYTTFDTILRWGASLTVLTGVFYAIKSFV